MFIQKYETLFERGCIKREQVIGVMDLKHLCRFVKSIESFIDIFERDVMQCNEILMEFSNFIIGTSSLR